MDTTEDPREQWAQAKQWAQAELEEQERIRDGSDGKDAAEPPAPTPTYLAVAKGSATTRRRLSEHFVIEEFDCHDGTLVPLGYGNQLEKWCHWYGEPLRDRFGSVHINSGYRTPAYNQSIGGASLSFHVYILRRPGEGVAADFTCSRGTPEEWAAFVDHLRDTKRHGHGGIGTYSTFVHADTRDYESNWVGP